jgi:hypothetical protein
MISYKVTKRLFNGTYQYKIVLVCAGASLFRSGDMDSTLIQLKRIDLTKSAETWMRSVKTQDELEYCFALQSQLKKLKDIDVRVESPWISIYSNSKSDINAIAKVNPENVKYISAPSSNSLEHGTILLPKIDFEFKVTLGKTSAEHSAFIGWAEANSKVKLTKTCKRDLAKDRSWGGTYFYITGDKNLLLAKMHLGGSINKVERIIKA